jgi:hypothetical protein
MIIIPDSGETSAAAFSPPAVASRARRPAGSVGRQCGKAGRMAATEWTMRAGMGDGEAELAGGLEAWG